MDVNICIACEYTAEGFSEAFRNWEKAVSGLRIRDSYCAYGDVLGAITRGELTGTTSTTCTILSLPEHTTATTSVDSISVKTLPDDATHIRFLDVLRAAVSTADIVLLTDSRHVVAKRQDLKQRRERETASARQHRVAQERMLRVETVLAGRVYLPVDVQKLYPYNTKQIFLDETLSDKTGVPYVAAQYERLAAFLLRKLLSTVLRDSVKAFFLDCDYTLWDGVLSELEDDAVGTQLKPYTALQKKTLAVREAGRLLCIVSKNDEDRVKRVFETHPKMVLKDSHISQWGVHFVTKKAVFVEEICNRLELSLNSAVFIDDNPGEVVEMQLAHPEVRSFLVSDANRKSFVKHCWLLDTDFTLTAADTQRNQSYAENAQRQTLLTEMHAKGDESKLATYLAFMERLALQVSITPIPDDSESLGRASQLTLRTNQFNSNHTLRLHSHEIAAFLGTPGQGGFSVSVKDSFGDYGTVGVVLYKVSSVALHSVIPETSLTECVDSTVLEVMQFCMSCRVLNRGIEHQLFREMARICSEVQRGDDVKRVCTVRRNIVRFPICSTEKNVTLRNVMRKVAKWYAEVSTVEDEVYQETESGCVYSFRAEILATICFESTFHIEEESKKEATEHSSIAPKETVLRGIVQKALDFGDSPLFAAALPVFEDFVSFFEGFMQRIVTTFSIATHGSSTLMQLGVSSMQLVQFMSGLGSVAAGDTDFFLRDPTVDEICSRYTNATPGTPEIHQDRTNQNYRKIVAEICAVLTTLGIPGEVHLDTLLLDLPRFDEMLLHEFFDAVQIRVTSLYAAEGIEVPLPPHWMAPTASALLTVNKIVEECLRIVKKRMTTQTANHVFASASDPSSPLHAAKEGNLIALQSFCSDLNLSAVASIKDRQGLGILAWGAGYGHSHIIEEACRIGLDPNEGSRDGRTPLMWACRNGHGNAVKTLLRLGAEVRAVSAKGNLCLHWAIWGGAVEVARLLLREYNLSVHDTNHSGCCSAIWAATAGDLQVCEWVRSEGGDFARLNFWGHGCIVKAAWRNNLPLLRWLLEGVPGGRQPLCPEQHLFYRDADKKLPIELAKGRGHTDVVAYLSTIMANAECTLMDAPSIKEGMGAIEM